MSSYKIVKIDITESQLKAAIEGKRIKISPSQFTSNGKEIALHPLQAVKVVKAMTSKKPVFIHLSDGELAETYRNMIMKGGSFFGNVWKGLKSVFKVLKDSGAASTLADMAVAPIAAYTGNPALVGAARAGLKQLTGVGIKRVSMKQKREMLRASGLYLS